MKQLILSTVVLMLGLSALSLVALTASRPDKLADKPLCNLKDSRDRQEAHHNHSTMWNQANCLDDSANDPESRSLYVDTRISSLSRDLDKPRLRAGSTNHRIDYLNHDIDNEGDDNDERFDDSGNVEQDDDDENLKKIVE